VSADQDSSKSSREESLQGFQRLCKDNHNVKLSETEAQHAAERLIRFLIASGKVPDQPRLSDREVAALDFVNDCIQQGYAPSVRDIATNLNLASSRSAHRIVRGLMAKNIVGRDPEGQLFMVH
jgi:hypothetical protein